MAQGVLFVLGFHLVVLSLVVRVFSVYLLVVWSRNIPRIYPTVLTFGIAGAFAGASGSFITYEGGVFCSPSPRTTKALLEIPLLIYSCIGILLQLGTTVAVTKTLVSVKINIMKSRILSTEKLQLSVPNKAKIVVMSYLKSAKLLWRTYITSMFLGAVMVFVTVQYTLYSRHGAMINDRLATADWVSCILTGSGESRCKKYLEGEGIYKRTLITVILLLLFIILFLMTEYRIFLFRAWYQFIKNPGALISKTKSNGILDNLDDSLSRVWLPEKLQNSFLGSARVKRNESATQKTLEAQLVAFAKNQEQQRLDEEQMLQDQQQFWQNNDNANKNNRNNNNNNGSSLSGEKESSQHDKVQNQNKKLHILHKHRKESSRSTIITREEKENTSSSITNHSEGQKTGDSDSTADIMSKSKDNTEVRNISIHSSSSSTTHHSNSEYTQLKTKENELLKVETTIITEPSLSLPSSTSCSPISIQKNPPEIKVNTTNTSATGNFAGFTYLPTAPQKVALAPLAPTERDDSESPLATRPANLSSNFEWPTTVDGKPTLTMNRADLRPEGDRNRDGNENGNGNGNGERNSSAVSNLSGVSNSSSSNNNNNSKRTAGGFSFWLSNATRRFSSMDTRASDTSSSGLPFCSDGNRGIHTQNPSGSAISLPTNDWFSSLPGSSSSSRRSSRPINLLNSLLGKSDNNGNSSNNNNSNGNNNNKGSVIGPVDEEIDFEEMDFMTFLNSTGPRGSGR